MFTYTREAKCKLYIGPVCDSTYQQEWKFLRLLYPTMKLHKEWRRPSTGNHRDAEDENGGFSTPNEGFINNLAFSKDKRKLLASSSSGSAYLFDPNLQKSVASVDVSEGPTLNVLFVGNYYFVTASADNHQIKLWDVRNTRKAINTLRGHSNLIRSLDYDEDSCKLISSAYDNSVRYWHIPSYLTEREDVDSDETANYRGILFKCPDVNQIAISWCSQKMLCINSKGVIFTLNNLNIGHLKDDVKLFRFDSSLPLLLSWISPNVSTNRRNSMRIIDSSDYNISPQFTVSKIHHLVTHPTLPVAMIRFSTTYRTLYSNKMEDWTSIIKLNQTQSVDDLTKFDTTKAFGMDIMEENLLFTSEHVRYCTMFEKKPCFSSCGRLLASPTKNGVHLLSFSDKLDMPQSVKNKPLLWSREPKSLNLVAMIPRDTDSVMCTKFSETDLLLAVGETGDRVSFHQPKL